MDSGASLPVGRFEQANGITLHVLNWSGANEAHPVILLHGAGANAWHWLPLATRLKDRFGDSVNIMAIDLRGCGDSDQPNSGYDLQRVASDVAAIHDRVVTSSATYIGHSRGGWLAAYIAGYDPERVASLVLVDPARLSWPSVDAADRFYNQIRSTLGPFDSIASAIQAWRRIYPTLRVTPAFTLAVRRGMRDLNDKLVGKMSLRALEEMRRIRLESDLVGPLLSRVTAPTFTLISSQSSRARQSEKYAYAARIRASKVQYFDTSHYVHHDAADSVADAVGAFILPRVHP